jgi:hypothetical protein
MTPLPPAENGFQFQGHRGTGSAGPLVPPPWGGGAAGASGGI